MTKQIYLIRHGETDWNQARKFQGQSDIPLNENGRAQAAQLAAELHDVLPFDRIVASDLGRAIETAEIIGRGHATPVLTDPGFREINFGAWEGLNESEIKARWPGDLQKWFDTGDIVAEGGETQDELYDRVWRRFRHWADKADYEKMAIVCHGGTGSALICAVLGEPAQSMHKFLLKNTAALAIDVEGDGRYSIDDERLRSMFIRWG